MKTQPSRSSARHAGVRRPASIAASSLAALGLLCAPSAEAQVFRYGLSETGKLVLDTTILNKLAGGSVWWDLAVFGADRYALRLDGRIELNGAKLYDLPLADGTSWSSLSVAEFESQRYVWALRNDGRVARNGEVIGSLPACDGCSYFDITAVDDTAYSLRTDGTVYEGNIQGPIFTFVGGEGSVAGHEDGTHVDTWWSRLTVSPVDGDIYALRQDGVVFRGELPAGDPEGQKQADLLSPTKADAAVLTGNLYVAIDVLPSGDWVTMRGDGNVYTGDNTVTPLLNFAGDPVGNDKLGETFLALDVQGSDIWALRWDGRLFRGDQQEMALAKYPKSRYRALAVTDVPPDLDNIKNGKPSLARYSAFAVEGGSVELPFLASDTDKLAEELVLELLSELPEGATFDAETRVLTFDPATPKGKLKLQVSVDDGVLAKPLKFKQSIKIVPADENPDKNKPPLVAKIKGLRALVGIPLELPILAVDPDGDALTVEPVTDAGIFAIEESDASYDSDTGVLSWTPRFEDVGKTYVRLLVSDGTVTKKVKIALVVASPLIDQG